MAQPHFSMYSPKSPGDGAGADVEPVFGATAEDDPGYAASLRSGTVLGAMRTMMLVLVAAPVLILAISPLIVQGEGVIGVGDAPLWLYLPPVAAALAAALIGPRAPAPPARDPAATRTEVARASMMQFRQAVLLRFALSEAVILIGLPLAMVGKSELVFAAGFVLGYPILIRLALPTKGGVERIRRRLEAHGVESHLWAALLAPSPPAPAEDAQPQDGTAFRNETVPNATTIPQDTPPQDTPSRDGAPAPEKPTQD